MAEPPNPFGLTALLSPSVVPTGYVLGGSPGYEFINIEFGVDMDTSRTPVDTDFTVVEAGNPKNWIVGGWANARTLTLERSDVGVVIAPVDLYYDVRTLRLLSAIGGWCDPFSGTAV
jgi:hypothetical protein